MNTVNTYKHAFLYNRLHSYSLENIERMATKNGLEVTDCSADTYPHVTVAEPDDDPLWQFHWVAPDLLVATWSYWDDDVTV